MFGKKKQQKRSTDTQTNDPFAFMKEAMREERAEVDDRVMKESGIETDFEQGVREVELKLTTRDILQLMDTLKDASQQAQAQGALPAAVTFLDVADQLLRTAPDIEELLREMAAPDARLSREDVPEHVAEWLDDQTDEHGHTHVDMDDPTMPDEVRDYLTENTDMGRDDIGNHASGAEDPAFY